MLDPNFTASIIAAWNADQAHPHRYRTKRELPPVEVIREFIDQTFLATLRDEEGRPTRFSVALVLDRDLEAPIGPTMLEPLRLESAAGFSAASLVKLASAFDPVLTSIVVRWDVITQSLRYWGVWFHAPGLNRFTEVPVCVVGSANFRPDFFTVIAKGRASLAIARGDGLIGKLQAGYFIPASPTPFTSSSLGQHVYAAIQGDPLFVAHGNTYWNYARDALELILSEAALRGHGGTIVLLPVNTGSAEHHYASKNELHGSFGLQATLQKCIESERSFMPDIAYRKLANETIQRIAQLAAVDGALILTFAFRVVAFGATLTAPRTSLSAIIGPDGFGRAHGAAFEINRYGTRHRSALDFAAVQVDSIVFVISQDGPIRAFRRADDNTVHVWPDCTASMFV